MASSSVLVTGGAGFIGRRVCASLATTGTTVTAIDSLRPSNHRGGVRPAGFPPDVELVVADVADVYRCSAIVERVLPDVVIHLAAETSTAGSYTQPSRHAVANVTATARMIEWLAPHPPAHIVLASSRAVYGEGTWKGADGVTFAAPQRTRRDTGGGSWNPVSPVPGPCVPTAQRADECTPRPVSVYGATKLAQENLLSAWCIEADVALSVLRIQNAYGPGHETRDASTGVLSAFAAAATERVPITLFEDGLVVRDFVHVNDVVRSITLSMEHAPVRSRVIDIGSGRPVTLHDVAVHLTERLGGVPPVVTNRFRPGDVRAAWCETDRALEEIDFTVVIGLEQGLDDLARIAENEPPVHIPFPK